MRKLTEKNMYDKMTLLIKYIDKILSFYLNLQKIGGQHSGKAIYSNDRKRF